MMLGIKLIEFISWLIRWENRVVITSGAEHFVGAGAFFEATLALGLVQVGVFPLEMQSQRGVAPVAVAATIGRTLVVFLQLLVHPSSLPLAVLAADPFEISELAGPCLHRWEGTLS